MIRNEGGKKPWVVRSHKGRSLGKFKTRDEAEKRLRQVEYFKHNKR